jgi:hypothetical protein
MHVKFPFASGSVAFPVNGTIQAKTYLTTGLSLQLFSFAKDCSMQEEGGQTLS